MSDMLSSSAPEFIGESLMDTTQMKMSAHRAPKPSVPPGPAAPSDVTHFANVRIARRAPKPEPKPAAHKPRPEQKPVLCDHVIPAVREANGEAELFAKVAVHRGRYFLVLSFGSGPVPKGVRIRIYLDKKELGSWDPGRYVLDRHECLIEFAVPSHGQLRAVLLDPHGTLAGKEVGVKLVTGAGWREGVS
jgi:hypothetical protein